MNRNKLIKLIDDWAGNVFDQNHKSPTETHRWIFCYHHDGLEENDCACCLTDYRSGQCECICHERIESLADYLIENGV